MVKKSGVKEGMVLVSAMHITAGVYVNDWEDGLIEDFQVWLEKLAPAGTAVPASPDRRRQRRRPPEANDHGAPGDGADHRRQAGSRTVGADLLCGVRRPAEEAGRRQGDGGARRESGTGTSGLGTRGCGVWAAVFADRHLLGASTIARLSVTEICDVGVELDHAKTAAHRRTPPTLARCPESPAPRPRLTPTSAPIQREYPTRPVVGVGAVI